MYFVVHSCKVHVHLSPLKRLLTEIIDFPISTCHLMIIHVLPTMAILVGALLCSILNFWITMAIHLKLNHPWTSFTQPLPYQFHGIFWLPDDITHSVPLNTMQSTHQVYIMNRLDFLTQMSDITGIFQSIHIPITQLGFQWNKANKFTFVCRLPSIMFYMFFIPWWLHVLWFSK